MTAFVFRPLVWTGRRTPADARRSRWTFKASWTDTLELLDRELYYLNATEPVIEADFRERDLRRDGMPRADARPPEFPGVKISFNTPHLGRLEYATDTHKLWQHNVRAIALSLEALRAVDRYGTTSGRQQYTGFRAIGSGATAMPAAKLSRADAITILIAGSGGWTFEDVDQDPEARIAAYRFAARSMHPDAGGSTADFQRLQEAKRVLEIP